jgi:hypothetical protein
MTDADKEKAITELVHNRMADLLNRTATALKGEPKPLSMHDWSDLPVIADTLRTQNQALLEALKEAVDGMGGSYLLWSPKARAAINLAEGKDV